MRPDLYIFSVKGDSRDQLRAVRLTPYEPRGWIAPRSVLAATKGSGGFRLLFLCGTDHLGRRCSEYPLEVVEIFAAYNYGNLDWKPPCDVAGDLLRLGSIDEVDLDATGRITRVRVMDTAPAFEDTRHLATFVVTVTDHGDTCDGHVRKLGVVHKNSDAQALIEEDKAIFRKMMAEASFARYDDKPNEIWYDDANGRTYDVIAV